MNLGIEGLRNCELFEFITTMLILKSGHMAKDV